MSGYYAAFMTGTHHSSQRMHRDQLPPPPRSWKDLQSYPQKEGFLAAATKEYNNLERRNTFRKVPRTSATRTLPVLWTFTYKVDTAGYLIKHKARFCVRGDLQPTTQAETYAATLAARTFRALMAITAVFDLEA